MKKAAVLILAAAVVFTPLCSCAPRAKESGPSAAAAATGETVAAAGAQSGSDTTAAVDGDRRHDPYYAHFPLQCASQYPWYFENDAMTERLDNNPIDPVYAREAAQAGSTKETKACNARYAQIWHAEIENAIAILEKTLNGEALDALAAAQAAWETYVSQDVLAAQQAHSLMLDSQTVQVMPLAALDKRLCRTRERALELASYCFAATGEYAFAFDAP